MKPKGDFENSIKINSDTSFGRWSSHNGYRKYSGSHCIVEFGRTEVAESDARSSCRGCYWDEVPPIRTSHGDVVFRQLAEGLYSLPMVDLEVFVRDKNIFGHSVYKAGDRI